MAKFTAPKGTLDVLAPQSRRYAELVARYAARVTAAGYDLVVLPMFEDAEVFTRLGESTDVVRKEMYEFDDKGGRRIALKPDGTAPVARAFIEHQPTTPWKVWYLTPKFRYERPQKGRYRQHHELGLEVIGTADPDIDVEVIAIAAALYADLGLHQVTLKLTSLGDNTCRPQYRELLQAYLEAHRDELCDEHRDRIAENPLRVLDCKRPACMAVTDGAPKMLDHLCDDCAAHFARVRAGLDALAIDYQVDAKLVRGLDYYTRTTFEFTAAALDAAQNGAGGGGRYDGLVETLGGKPTPGIGFGLGIERILLACDAEQVFPAPDAIVDVFVIDTTGGEAARDVTHALRAAGMAADRAFDARSFKSQLTAAQRSGARFAVVIEDDGLQLRTLTEKGEPEVLTRDTVVDAVRKRLS
ncbi:MAG TPA: histidine--tRNA ligase [Acidimicrobiales bacterium]|nr:histidine--tRNA ligase [Acidimicrobiales bacterium]